MWLFLKAFFSFLLHISGSSENAHRKTRAMENIDGRARTRFKPEKGKGNKREKSTETCEIAFETARK